MSHNLMRRQLRPSAAARVSGRLRILRSWS